MVGSEQSNNKREEREKDDTNIISRTWAVLKGLKPIMLSHHPDCENFEDHTIQFGKYRFCIGCFVGYPVAITSVILLYFILQVIPIANTILFWVGVGCMSSVILSPLNLTDNKGVKIIQKIAFNVGGAFLLWWTLRLTRSLFLNVLIFLTLFNILFILINSYHAYGLIKTCRECEYHSKWGECPGFAKIFRYCEENNLPNIFKALRRIQMQNRTNQ